MFSISKHSLNTRTDMQHALRALVAPLRQRFSAGGARVMLGATDANYPRSTAEMEGFARPLWGLAPLQAGGGHFDGWDEIRSGLIHGTDPNHPEYWGTPADFDQHLVEMAPLALALLLIPATLWDPLPASARAALADYLRTINTRVVCENNWLFFRVLVNLALTRLDASPDRALMTADLDRLESYYLGEGWYSDGRSEQRDYYVAFAMHFYGLLYASLARDDDRQRCERFRERAAVFSKDFIHWFAADGAALPYGRSLTYRFAQSAFWGALAFAGVPALPWGVIKGLAMRNLRWWLRQPIFTETGVLTVGYAYPNATMAEEYNSPSSPYWAFKAFLPLALPATHPFWSEPEQALPILPAIVRQPHARMLITRDRDTDHVVALAGGQWAGWEPRHVAEKYAKFCYSTHFGFSVPAAAAGLAMGAHDSMLALSEDGHFFRVRRECRDIEVAAGVVTSTWRPWPDVEIRTWLLALGTWHLRVHRIRSRRSLHTAEGGFALDCTGDDRLPQAQSWGSGVGFALAKYSSGVSVIRDLRQRRVGEVVRAAPNTNLMAPRTVIPTLRARHNAGKHWLACVVLGRPGDSDAATFQTPNVSWQRTWTGFKITDRERGVVFAC